MFEVIGSRPSREDVLPQHEVPLFETRSAARPYFCFTTSLVVSSLTALHLPSIDRPRCHLQSSLRAARTTAARGRCRGNHRQTDRPDRNLGLVTLEVIIEVVDLPLHAVGILHPELILVGVATVDPHLFRHGESCSL